MKILQLCSRVAFPPSDGGTVAMYNMARDLIGKGVELNVLALNPLKQRIDIQNIPEEIRICPIEAVDVDTNVTFGGAVKNFILNKSYVLSRFDVPDMHAKLQQKLLKEKYDVVQLEGLQMTSYIKTIRLFSKAKVVFRPHNVEHHIWKGNADNEQNPIKRSYLNSLALQLKRYELEVLKKIDALVTISPIDADFFADAGYHGPSHTAITGIDLKEFVPDSSNTEIPSVFHVGAMDWEPNLKGIEWFLGNVWPKVTPLNSGAKFYLAGKNMPQSLKDISLPNYVNLGEVPNLREFMNSKQIMVVPLFSGSGIRIKILEGMALGKTVVASPQALQGIKYKGGTNLFIAQSKEEFVEKILRCIGDAKLCAEVGANARILAEEQFDKDKIIAKLLTFYKSL
ncbi:MAG: glycosyltransferase [Flavobacteriaceae bacterium]|nr:glycosyltransferase [Flavobacteriaceae bacterium]